MMRKMLPAEELTDMFLGDVIVRGAREPTEAEAVAPVLAVMVVETETVGVAANVETPGPRRRRMSWMLKWPTTLVAMAPLLPRLLTVVGMLLRASLLVMCRLRHLREMTLT
jgi:hypothetical protein